MRPELGSTWSTPAKKIMSSTPNQKIGIETPTSARIVASPSMGEFLWVAEITPSTTPITAAMMMATSASSTVAGKRESSSWVTGVCV